MRIVTARIAKRETMPSATPMESRARGERHGEAVQGMVGPGRGEDKGTASGGVEGTAAANACRGRR